MRLHIFSLLSLVVLGLATPLVRAQAGEAKVIEDWRNSLRGADDATRAGEWKRAKKTVNSVLGEMCDRISSGEGVAGLFAYATFVRAVAESGLGDEGRASWDFHVAQTLRPELSEAKLEVYGEVGQRLGRWRVEDADDRLGDHGIEAKEIAGEVVRPRKTRAPRPKYPFGKKMAGAEAPIIVRLIIDQEGIPRSPRLLTKQEPLLGFAALEALRDWRFKPASLDGEPVAVYFNVVVNFKLLDD